MYIKDFDGFMFHKINNKSKKYFCKSYLQCFSIKNVLTEHKKNLNNFNKNLIMTEKEEQHSQSNNLCWIYEKPIEGEKVRDYCYITGNFRGAAHWSYNINLQLTKKVPVIFHNLF